MVVRIRQRAMHDRAAQSGSASKREQSTIGFPYIDLENAMTVARGLLNSGGMQVTRDQLAVAMDLAPGSGNFVVKVAAARLFGLIDFSQGKYELTDLGHEILDPAREKAAKVEAFYKVPLYKRLYDEFRGKQLPPRPHGIEQAFVKFGVSPKQKDKARWAFEKTAMQAGFFNGSQDRLIEPIVGSGVLSGSGPSPAPEIADEDRSEAPIAARRSLVPETQHPFIEGLLKELPKPGTQWGSAGRKKWLDAAANIFDLMYGDDEQGKLPR
ncbi:hypothetical protein [Dongia sedimenti]|uniref:Uncharacterized protein n=1 Tax=Dongia sedimenti TaxID=3064282 RepID=A0ABU0YPH0_9PROT|nr:hypothetical protein [Rhodospirillaceae bacterium R-7]